jgi:lactate dehydrogenase-like 2-hydroxyacid dehydrogenase
MLGLSRELMDRMPALEIIAVNGIGTDAVDLDEARRRGVRVTTTPDVLTDDVADLAMALLLATFRRLCESDRFVRAGRWPSAGLPVARRVTESGLAYLASVGSVVQSQGVRRHLRCYTDLRAAEGVSYRFVADLVDLARDVDALVVAASGGAGSKHLVNTTVLKALGAEGVLINVARGSVVDEVALVAALVDGRLGGPDWTYFQRTKCALGAVEHGAGCSAAASCQRDVRDPRRHGRFISGELSRSFRRPSPARRGGMI